MKCGCRRLVALALCAWLWTPGARSNADEPQFSPSPRLAISQAEAELIRAAPDFSNRKKAAVELGEALLRKPVVVPVGPGQWIFYYACSDDGTSLQPRSASEHVCPRCQRVYSDQRTVEAYRTQLHAEVDAAALTLGWAYWFSRDDRFAAEARRLLVRLADDYPNYPQRRDRWGRSGILATIGGRRYIQSLDEAVAVIALAKSYDLTRDAAVWSDDDRRHVERDLFQSVAATLLWWNSDRNNHQTWYNAGLMAIGSVLADAEIVHKALDRRGGFFDQLQRSVGDDGLWYEGALAYHNYALQAMVEIVEAGRRLGLPLHEQPRFRSMFTGPLDYVYPNGQFPAMNDSDESYISSFDAHFQWAWNTYRDPRFAQAYARGDRQRLSQLPGAAEIDPTPPEPTSKTLTGVGVAVLRRGRGANAACAMLDFGQHGDGHGHFDKLNLVLFADGREWLLDPGRLTYSHPEYKTWVKETVAHNTVTLHGQSQRATTGRLLWFDDHPDHVACAAQSDGAYTGATHTRYLLLTDRFLVDRFDVETEAATQIDWHAHVQGGQLTPADDLPAGEPMSLGDRHGYQHLKAGRVRSVAAPTRFDFIAAPGKSLRVWLADSRSQQIFQSIGIGYTTDQPAPCLTRRIHSTSARFWTVYELVPRDGVVQAVTVSADAADRIAIETKTDRWTIAFDSETARCQRTPK